MAHGSTRRCVSTAASENLLLLKLLVCYGVGRSATLHAQIADFFLGKIAVFLCRSEERSLRGLILDWRKCVDIRLSLALKFGLLKQKFVRDTRMLHQALQQVSLDALATTAPYCHSSAFRSSFTGPLPCAACLQQEVSASDAASAEAGYATRCRPSPHSGYQVRVRCSRSAYLACSPVAP